MLMVPESRSRTCPGCEEREKGVTGLRYTSAVSQVKAAGDGLSTAAHGSDHSLGTKRGWDEERPELEPSFLDLGESGFGIQSICQLVGEGRPARPGSGAPGL
jgi:hypothetical protein